MQNELILLVVTAYMYKWCLVHSGGNFLTQIGTDKTHLLLNLSYKKGGQEQLYHFFQPYQMASSQNSYTQFSRGQNSQFDGEIRYCHCGHRTTLRTSRTQQNMGMRFLGCALYEVML